MIANRIFFLLLFIFGLVNSIQSNTIDESKMSYDIVTTDIGFGVENCCALRDKYGFIWVGTKTGLQCFDGNGKPVYEPNSVTLRGISNLYVSSFFENGEDIWIGGNGGLYVFDRFANRIQRFLHKTNYGVTISSLVEKIVDAGQGRIWISTQGQGFFIFNTSDSSLVQNSRHGSFYSDMAVGANGLLYLASINGLIQFFKPDGEFVGESRLPEYSTDKNGISIEASGHDIWISAGSNLYRLDTQTGSATKILSNYRDIVINTLLARPDGTLLLGTNTGLWSYNTITQGNPIHIVAEKNRYTVGDARISSLSPDIDDDILLVHPTGALEIMTTKSQAVKYVPLPSATSMYGYNSIRAIAITPDHNGLWIGSDNGLYFYDIKSGTFDNRRVPTMDNKAITSLVIDNSKLWIGTRLNGVVRYDIGNGEMRQFVYNENIPYTVVSNEINDIYRTSSGDMYILTNWGVCRYDSINDNFPQLTEFGQQTRGTVMQEDTYGGLWIATTNNGLYYRSADDTRFRNDGCDSSGEAIPVTMMHVDRKGRLWAATQNNGLFIYDHKTDKFPHYEVTMLNHKSVSFMADDKSDALWIGANDLLLKMDDKDDISIYNFSRHDEWTPVTGVVESLDDGRSVIGCRSGFLFFDPGKVKSGDNRVKVYPLSISLPFLTDDSDELSCLGLNTLLYMKDGIEIPYDDNTFTIHLSATRPVQMPDIRFDYMMEGIDKSWITGISIPEVTYNNLPAGEYRLLLRPHGVKDAHVSALPISILPPWYLSRIAFAGYFILVIGFIYGLIVIIRKILRRKYKRQLHDMRAQKEREVFEAKTRYFVDLVHEIRTPLMLISLPLEQLAEEVIDKHIETKDKNKTRYIKSMQHNIDYLLGITNQLLDFRRAENSSEIQLSLSRCNINMMLSDICRRFDEPMKISGKTVTLNLPDHDIYATIDEDKTERLLMNLVGNAMKYATHSIVVTLNDTSADSMNISVADDGPGVPADERERIFDAYYQIGNDNVAASLGTGLGLAYAKLIAVAHKGNISVGENQGGGAVFTITLPVGDDIVVSDRNDLSEASDDIAADIPANRDKTILVVEDNADLREMITEALGHHYTVITAIDGVMALDILKSNDIDIIVSDVMMLRMNGLELCRAVKNDINYSHIPFIILTAKTGREAQAEGMESGADVYLEKPFPIRQLVYQIGNLLRTRQLFYDHMRNGIGNEATVNTAVAESSGLNKMDTEFLEKMNETISDSIANEEFSIDLLADRLNMSRSSFYRKITAVTGMSPSDYLKNYRLRYAMKLLDDGCRVTEVADRVGFTSSSYFARCFKEKFGILPRDYVLKSKSKRAAENG